MTDSWTSSVWDGRQWLSGAAAREHRIKAAGGVDSIVLNASRDAVRNAFNAVEKLVDGAAKAKSNVVSIRRVRRAKG
ncbi:hypothetical protein D9M68_636840 [compost metagenome]